MSFKVIGLCEGDDKGYIVKNLLNSAMPSPFRRSSGCEIIWKGRPAST